jgi:hypothetical protein
MLDTSERLEKSFSEVAMLDELVASETRKIRKKLVNLLACKKM